MSEAVQQSTPIDQIKGERVKFADQNSNEELVDNVKNTYNEMNNSEEEDNLNDSIYNRNMNPEMYETFEQNNNNISQNVKKPPSNMNNNLVNSLKSPVIVLVLFFILNLELVSNMTLALLKRVISFENNYLGTIGLLIRSLIASILYFIINKFI